MDFFQTFGESNEFRDKIFRVFQYSTHLLWALKDNPNNKSQIKRLKEIENSISLSRQMLRFGKCLNEINLSLNSMYLQDSYLRTSITLSRISNSLYLLCDNFVWLSKMGIIAVDENRVSKLANSYWLYSNLLLLTKNAYQMHLVFQNLPRSLDNAEHYKENNPKITIKELLDCAYHNKTLSLDIVKNLCDICLSLNGSSKMVFSSTFIGFAGVVSSVIPLLKYRTIY